MSVVIVTGSAGLIGSETVRFFAKQGMDVVGVDNDMRAEFFGAEASTVWNLELLEKEVSTYRHVNADIRDENAMQSLFQRYGSDVKAVVHCAAQPSHDWAASDPFKDFTVNANGTLVLLETTRQHATEKNEQERRVKRAPARAPLARCPKVRVVRDQFLGPPSLTPQNRPA